MTAQDFVNKTQTPEERAIKYAFCRLAGFTAAQSRRLRDCRTKTIGRHIYAKHYSHEN